MNATFVIPPKTAPKALRSNGQGCRVIGTAKTKSEIFGITVNDSTIGVVPVDLERGVRRRQITNWLTTLEE